MNESRSLAGSMSELSATLYILRVYWLIGCSLRFAIAHSSYTGSQRGALIEQRRCIFSSLARPDKLSCRTPVCWVSRQVINIANQVTALTPDTWAEKFESFERINSIRETNGNFDPCNSCKRLVSSRLHESHKSKFPFVSRIEFIRSKLSNFSPHVSGVTVAVFGRCGYGPTADTNQVLRECNRAGQLA